MSVNIRFYQVDDPINKVNKTLPSEFLQCDCVFRYPCDSRNPVLTIDLSNVQDELGLDDPQESGVFVYRNYNYASIEFYSGTGRRFYYVQETKVINNTIIEVSLKIDPLKTYSLEIGNLSLYVERSASSYHNKLEDNLLPLSTCKTTSKTSLTSNSSCVTFGISTFSSSTKFIAVTCLVKNDTIGDSGYGLAEYLTNHYTTQFPTRADAVAYLHTRSPITPPSNVYFDPDVVNGMNSFNPAVIRAGYTIITYVIGLERLEKLMDLVYSHDEKRSYILGVTAIPISNIANYASYDAYDVPMFIGDDDPNPTLISGCYILRTGQMSRYIPVGTWDNSQILGSASFLKFEPFSTYELFIPYYGYVSIPAHQYLGTKGMLYYQIDLVTGEATAFVRIDKSDASIISVKCQVGMPIPLNSTNYHEIENAKRTNNINTAFGLLSSLATIGVGVASANPVAIGMGAMGATSAIVKGVNSNLNLIQKANVMYTQFDAPYYDHLTPHIKSTHQETTVSSLSDYRAKFGAPLQEVALLSTLTGFTICGGDIMGQLGTIRSVRDQEEIASLLRTGVIL